MGFIGTIIGAIGSALKFVAALFGFIENRELIEAGVKKQQVADLTETVKEAEDANVIQADVHSLSDDELNRRLRDGGASGP